MIDQDKGAKLYNKGFDNGVIRGTWQGRNKERKELINMLTVALAAPGISRIRADVALTLLKEKLENVERQIVLEKRQARRAHKKNANVHTSRNH